MIARIGRAALCVALLVPMRSVAQSCTDAQALEKDGGWVIEPEQGFDTDVPLLRRQYPSLAAASDRAIALLQQTVPSPRGVTMKLHRAVNRRTLTGTGHVRYEVRAQAFSWSCLPATGSGAEATRKLVLADEADGGIVVWFNSSGTLTNERQQVSDLQTADGQRIFYALAQRDSLRGEALYEPSNVGPRTRRALVLTPDGASIWRPLTRDELLGARLAAAQARVDTLHARLPSLQAVPDTTRVLPQFRATLRLLESERDAVARTRSALLEPERALPAVVANPYAAPSALFVDAAAAGKELVVLKRGILQRGRPRRELGLITVEWNWQGDDTAQAAFMQEFAARLDVAALRRMLTKP